MSFWEFVAGRWPQLLADACQQAGVVAQCVLLASLAGVGLAAAAYRSERLGRLALACTVTVWTIPSYALLGLLVPVLGLGVPPTVAALVLYGLLPVVRNTVVGLRGVDPALVDAARGIGMGRVRRMLRVELPVAWPAVLAGIRLAAQMLMGIAAIAAYASGPGLGNEIFDGIASLGGAAAIDEVLAGTLGIAVLALAFDAALVLAGRLTVSRGIRG